MNAKTKEIDQEWISLMLTAKKMNITPEEIRHFIHQASNSVTKKKTIRNRENGWL